MWHHFTSEFICKITLRILLNVTYNSQRHETLNEKGLEMFKMHAVLFEIWANFPACSTQEKENNKLLSNHTTSTDSHHQYLKHTSGVISNTQLNTCLHYYIIHTTDQSNISDMHREQLCASCSLSFRRVATTLELKRFTFWTPNLGLTKWLQFLNWHWKANCYHG
jgi:hypothetical protein